MVRIAGDGAKPLHPVDGTDYHEVPAKDGNGTRTLTEIVVTGFAKLDRARRGEAVPETEGAAS